MYSLNTTSRFPSILTIFLSVGFVLGAGLTTPTWAEDDPAAIADVTGDGTVNILDVSAIGSRFGLQAGEAGYREGLDLVPDSIIDMPDLSAVLAQFGQTGVQTSPTSLSGRIFDGLGNPLPGATVKLGTNTVEAVSGMDGSWKMDSIPASDFGENLITFDGSTVSPSDDPTPDFLSGQYPTIPNKPIFINAGISNEFRDMSLPERDLTGSVD